MEQPQLFSKKEVFNGEEVETLYRQARVPVDPEDGLDLSKMEGIAATAHGFCAKFNQRAYVNEDGILCEQDVPVVLRDGTKIYVDIYRPEGETNIPCIVSWSYYGKRPGDGMSEWQVMGVPPGTISTMSKFESPDPGYWCRHGYAIANVDPRGTGHSEGDINMFGTQDAKDGYDFIEWVASQHWCNGRVGMGGNSCVAMTQFRIAAQQPPHLACIAPWEATTDIYRESIYEGGIPALTFNEFIVASLTGPNKIDDQVAMGRKYPLMNAYWEDKIPDFKKIKVPTYTCASYSHFHLRGSFNAFRKIRSTRKWMRAHREQEWPDMYNPNNIEDLKRFFDRYLRNINNGWEMTPRYRIEVMDAFDCDYQTNRPEKEFPLARTQYKKLYLDAKNMTMQDMPVETETKVSYDANEGVVNFDMAFEEDTEITGYMKLRLFVEAEGHDDMDIFINIQKADKDGNWLPTYILGEPHPGTWGKMRVSHRALDEKLSTDYEPVQSHLKEEKLSPGEIVPVDIAIVPSSKIWHKGQKIRIQVAGRYIREGWFEPLSWETDNKGNHVVHTGGKYESFLQIPVIPPKYQAGDYVYR
ncbi:CocE/NonD family hydrolase [Konateibacter massiliensis]|uniref:CocE/NonD family hydrolase n=1 Tax=Konateibacter massiliensis TaxID=2002841 RepID=UPI000C154101|nr:CocE/NonD family hydrolase [Konateibacter massiliensis]